MAECPKFVVFEGNKPCCTELGVGTDLGCWGYTNNCWAKEYKADQVRIRRNVFQNIRKERLRAQTLESRESGEVAVVYQ